MQSQEATKKISAHAMREEELSAQAAKLRHEVGSLNVALRNAHLHASKCDEKAAKAQLRCSELKEQLYRSEVKCDKMRERAMKSMQLARQRNAARGKRGGVGGGDDAGAWLATGAAVAKGGTGASAARPPVTVPGVDRGDPVPIWARSAWH